jgi:hypothetical protein
MSRLRQTALVVLLLLAGQMGAAAVASADRCCPAMAGAEGSESPCSSLAALGCCEAQAPHAAPDPAGSTPPALLACAGDAPPAVPGATLPSPSRCRVAAERALRHTILRL